MKVDMKSAYLCLHYTAGTVIQAMVTIGAFTLVALHMTFGGEANLSQWSDVSELATDLANDLVKDNGWDHDQLVSLHQELIGEAMETEGDNMPFSPASNVMVDLPADDAPKADCYIDDIFSAFLEQDVAHGLCIIPFILHQESESMARDDMLSINMFLAEATPGEHKLVLGWLVDD